MSRSEKLGVQREVELREGTIRYRERGEGQPVLFVHGLGVNGDLWRDVVGGMGDGYRCIAPDWPLGSHEVPMGPDADLSVPGLAQLVAHFMDALDLEDVTLVGNDTGGAICQYVAVRHPERLGRIVLTSCDAFENFLPPLFRYLQLLSRVPGSAAILAQSLRLRPAQRLPIAYGWLTKRPIPPEVMDSYLEPGRASGGVRRDLTRVLRAVDRRYTLEAAERLGSFDRPALVVWAEEDRVFPPDHARRLAAILPDARVEMVSDSYTFLPEDQPQRLTALIAGFARDRATVA